MICSGRVTSKRSVMHKTIDDLSLYGRRTRYCQVDEELTISESRWPGATNESLEPGIFMSQEARIEDTRRGETVWVPGPSNPSSYYDREDASTEDEIECMWSSWRLLHPQNLVIDPFSQPIAHTKCLKLFEHHASCINRSTTKDHNSPSGLPQLVSALKLRMTYQSDSCQKCSKGAHTARMPLWSHSFFGAAGFGGSGSPWMAVAGHEIFCADPIPRIDLDSFARSYVVDGRGECRLQPDSRLL